MTTTPSSHPSPVSGSDTLCGRSWESARQRGAEILPRMHDREDLDHGRADAIAEPVRAFHDLPDVQLTCLAHTASRLEKALRLPQTKDEAVDHLLGVHGRRETDVLRDAAELLGRLPSSGAADSRGAADPPAHARERVLVREGLSAIGLRDALLQRLLDVHLVGEIIPRGGFRQSLNEQPRVGLDAGMLSHTGRIARKVSSRKRKHALHQSLWPHNAQAQLQAVGSICGSPNCSR